MNTNLQAPAAQTKRGEQRGGASSAHALCGRRGVSGRLRLRAASTRRLGFRARIPGGMVSRCQVRMGKPSGMCLFSLSLHRPGSARPDPGDRHRRGGPSRLRRLCSGLPNESQVHSANSCSAGDGLEDQLVSKGTRGICPCFSDCSFLRRQVFNFKRNALN